MRRDREPKLIKSASGAPVDGRQDRSIRQRARVSPAGLFLHRVLTPTASSAGKHRGQMTLAQPTTLRTGITLRRSTTQWRTVAAMYQRGSGVRGVRCIAGAVSVAVLMAACAGAPTPSATAPALTVDLEIEVRRAPDPMLQFFASEVHARLSDGRWSTEWIVPEGSTSTRVPSGILRLDMWTVVRGDTLECITDPATARESCSQPIIGTGQTCSVTMDLATETRVSVRLLILSQERCELLGGAS